MSTDLRSDLVVAPIHTVRILASKFHEPCREIYGPLIQRVSDKCARECVAICIERSVPSTFKV